jgi:hypothetical protein
MVYRSLQCQSTTFPMANKRRILYDARMDEGRKRVVAGILVSRQLETTEVSSPRTESMVRLQCSGPSGSRGRLITYSGAR